MAAGLGFKTFTTGEVLTAADTNGYLMQGVLVFASAAARDSAITSPQEGQTCYLKDTDVIQVYSGSAWVTKSGTGLVLLNTTSMSAVASQSINDVFSSAYDNYRIVINGTTITGTLTMRFRVSGSDSSAASYKMNIYGTGLWTSAAFAGYTEVNSTNFNVLAEASPASITLDVLNPFATQKTFINGFTTQDDRGKSYNGIFNATTSFTGFSLIPTTNITGTVSVYGYSK